MKKMEAAGTPGPAHRALAGLVGDWKAEVKCWCGPGGEAQVSQGRAKASLKFDGRFLEEDFHGEAMGRPFSGYTLMGYDNTKQSFTSVWISDTQTATFVSEGKGQVVHFPTLDLRIPLTRGTVLIFDTCQPHAVIPRDSTGLHAGDFPVDQDGTQLFLTWELPGEDPRVAQALRIAFDVQPRAHDDAGLLRGGAPASVDPESGCWRDATRDYA